MERYYYKCVVLFLVLTEIAQICLCVNSNVPCIEQERQALLEFRSSITIDRSNRLSSWKGGHCCRWEGVGCDNVTGHVYKLDLKSEAEGVAAPYLSSSLLQLEHLTYLDLSGNTFSGSPIPMFIGSMVHLQYLSLSGACFGGRIPNSLGNLKNLHFLDLSYNYYYPKLVMETLQMNDDINWISKLHSLKHLDLSDVLLNDTHNLFQVLNTLPSLLHLSLYGCEIDNSLIPSYAFQNMTSLVYLDLSFNELIDPIPVAFRNLSSIKSLNLGGNNFTSIPSWFSDFQELTLLDLSFNGFHGQIPHVVTNLSSLVHLDFSYNQIDSIPSSSFRNVKNFVNLDLSYNRLYGPIPETLRNMTSIESLDLSRNNFTLVPWWFCNFEKLTYLDLSSNGLHGPIHDFFQTMLSIDIPLSIGKLSQLQMLDLSSNKLDGPIPQSIGKLENLYYLDLSNNFLNGLIPESLGQLVNLNILDISSNKLDGIMTMKNGWHLNLIYLNLSHNQITGSLPKNIGHIMFSLKNLFLGNNQLNGSIPISLCQLQLSNLDLSNNNLSGEIPNCWKDNQELSEINLSSNKLSGAFPSSFGNLSSLFWLYLKNNKLEGELPTSFKNLKQLLILDIGQNQFSGSIPSSWTIDNFPQLQVLILRKNILNGSIPSQLCQLKSLQILDLSMNKLHGSIPQCIGNLEGMMLKKSISSSSPSITIYLPTRHEPEWSKQVVTEVVKGRELEYKKILKLVVLMDLSQNNLIGTIPDEITRLTGLLGLNLSKNHLKGEIPQLIGNMKSLESFDISHNQVSGTIPKTMSALTSLSRLNLSHNNMSGPIPKDNQFLTFDNPSIFSYNPYLCGSPLPNMCPGDISHENGTSTTKGDEDEDKVEKVWFYFVIALGFASGLWGVIGTLWLKKDWRHAYFRWVEDVADDIYVAVVIKAAKIKKKIMRN